MVPFAEAQRVGKMAYKLHRTVLLLNGLFLTGMGGAFAAFDLWGLVLVHLIC